LPQRLNSTDSHYQLTPTLPMTLSMLHQTPVTALQTFCPP